MKAWLTVLALAAAAPRPAPALPVADTQAVAPATAPRLAGLGDLMASLAEAQAAGAQAAALALEVPVLPLAWSAPMASMPMVPMAPSPWPLEPSATGAANAPPEAQALRALAFSSASALPRDLQSLQALARAVPGAAQLARELREVPREQRLGHVLDLLQDPAVQSELLGAAAALRSEDAPPAGSAWASWADYGLGVAVALLGALACIAPRARRRGLGRMFTGPQPPLPPAFAAARGALHRPGPRVRRKVHLSPLNRPLPTTQATAHAPRAG